MIENCPTVRAHVVDARLEEAFECSGDEAGCHLACNWTLRSSNESKSVSSPPVLDLGDSIESRGEETLFSNRDNSQRQHCSQLLRDLRFLAACPAASAFRKTKFQVAGLRLNGLNR
jgi:hypothetical protein